MKTLSTGRSRKGQPKGKVDGAASNDPTACNGGDDMQSHDVQRTGGDFVINTTDLGAAEQALSELFGTIRLSTSEPPHTARTQVWRSYIGDLSVDDVKFNFDMSYVMDPPDCVLLCRVRSGVLEETLSGQESRRHGTGAVVAFGAIEGRPLIGKVERAHYYMLSVPRHCLTEAAGDILGATAHPLALTDSRPLTPAANQHLVDVIDHIRHGVLSNPGAVRESLVAGAVTRYVAASMLATFPNTLVDS